MNLIPPLSIIKRSCNVFILSVVFFITTATAQAADPFPSPPTPHENKGREINPTNNANSAAPTKQSFYVYLSPDVEEHAPGPVKPPRGNLKEPQSAPEVKPKPQKVDEKEALHAEMNLAELGDAEAQLHVGVKLYRGKGAAQDRKKGLAWILEAAGEGKYTPESLGILGRAYFSGADIGKNDFEARKWLQLSADQGNVSAKNDLGYMLYNGLGGDRDFLKAFELYKQASAYGDTLAQANLGTMYATGSGTSVDKVRAYAWFSLAASQGNVSAATSRNALLKDLSWDELNLAQKNMLEIYNEVKTHKSDNQVSSKGRTEHSEVLNPETVK